VMGYYELARECRLLLTSLKKSRPLIPTEGEKDEILEAEITLWDTRLQELGVRVASALVEMEDLEGAARFLATLSTTSSTLQSQKALLFLCLGDVDAARLAISNLTTSGEENKVILALAHMADSDFSSAATIWEELISSSTSSSDISVSMELPMYTQNLAVCLLYLGRMSEVCPLPSPLFPPLAPSCPLSSPPIPY